MFDAAKARANVASAMALIVEDETELVGHLAASKLNRLARRTEEPVTKDALAFDEFLTAVVMLSWLTYGFRVPQTWTAQGGRAPRASSSSA